MPAPAVFRTKLVEDEETFRVDAIRSVELTTPRYKKPSRLMTKMVITLAIAGSEYTVTLDLFPDTVFMLGLSIYGANNELVTMTGEITSPINPKPGCRFMARCPYASDKCNEPQKIEEILPNHFVSCCKCREINHL